MGKPLPVIPSPRGTHPSLQEPFGAPILHGPRSLVITLPEAYMAAEDRLLYRPPVAVHTQPRLGLLS